MNRLKMLKCSLGILYSVAAFVLTLSISIAVTASSIVWAPIIVAIISMVIIAFAVMFGIEKAIQHATKLDIKIGRKD